MSVLIFGLGAAALLRAAHEEFAYLPARRTAPEPMFARPTDDQPSTLALLRIDTSVEEKPAENLPAAPVPEVAADALAQTGQASDPDPAQPEKLVALEPAESTQPEAATPEVAKEAIAESPAAVPAPTAETQALVSKPEATLASVADTATPAATAPPPPSPDVYSFEGNPAATRIATLGGPAVIVDEKAAADASEKTEAKTSEVDRSAIKKRAAERARERRRIAAARRARLAREAVLTLQQQQPNPFIQTPFAQGPITRTTR
ncbi:hypothetical protein J6524_26945 [Bradyrhizobium sp. WSM 1738]|uniref:hypothetical protein n=1 Tax=Bradyrhizobium hereditatis TaxID=2821405 RepID=UPI001CE2AF14|nr:hypothetical protein [Bradyrhizobium hereditatis]MCA6118485.1 hypothetical protein [Bradyrhizobium hereditatis]